VPSNGKAEAILSDQPIEIARAGNEGKAKGFLERRAKVLAVGIVLLALALRLGAVPFQTLESDESQAILTGRFDFLDLLECKAFDIGNPQGFHLFLSAMRQVFGENILIYRLANILISTLAVAIIMALCRQLVPQAPIWLGVGLLTAVNPMHLMFSLQLRPWAVQALTLSLAMWAVLWWRRDHRWRHLAIFVLAMFLAFNTNYSAVFCWAALGLWWLWDSRRNGRHLATVVLVNALLGVLLIPTLIFLGWQIQQQEFKRATTWMLHLFGFPYYFIYCNSVGRAERSVWLMFATVIPAVAVLAPSLLMGLRAVWKTVKPRGFVLTTLFLPILFLMGLCLRSPFFNTRYLAFIWPIFALTVMLGLSTFRPWIRRTALAMLLGMELAGCIGYVGWPAMDYPPFLYPTLQAHAGPHFGIILYPRHEQQLILQWSSQQGSSQPKIIMIRGEKLPRLVVQVYPDSPTDYVKTYPIPQEELSVVLARGLPEELWFYCDLRPKSLSPQLSKVLEQVKQMLNGSYRLEETWHWPSEQDSMIQLLKFHRIQSPASRESS
jgi:hypothetical protein